MEISDDRLQKALTYLATTDAEAARAKALVEGLSEQRKTVKAILFQAAQGSNQVREAEAYASEEYTAHINKLTAAVERFETLRNKRLTESLIVEVWRSCNANRRNGNI